MKDRILRDFKAEETAKIAGTFRMWKRGEGYADQPGFCASVKLADIAAHGHVLTPGRYVGTEAVAADGEPFEEKLPRLFAELRARIAESAKLEQAINRLNRGTA